MSAKNKTVSRKQLNKIVQSKVQKVIKNQPHTFIAHVPVKELLDFSEFFSLTPEEYQQWSRLQDFPAN